MKLITRDTDYAIRALCYIVNCKTEKVCVKEIVKELKIPQPFLRKIFQILNRKGILKSYKGKNGGFVLSTSPDKIFLRDLIEVFQGPFKLNECIFRNRRCSNIDICPLKREINNIERCVVNKLKYITLKSLLSRERNLHGKKKNNKN